MSAMKKIFQLTAAVLAAALFMVSSASVPKAFLFSPVVNVQGITCDPSYSSVLVLLHFDGTNGSTTFTDQKGNTWAAVGTAQLDTSTKLFGTASLNLSTADKITSSISSLNFGTGPFTIEVQFFYTTNPATYEMFTVAGSSGTYFGIKQSSGTTWNIAAAHDGGTEVLSGNVTVNTSTWTSFAISRSGDNLYMFQNGTLISTITGQVGSNYNFDTAAPVQIGTGAGQSANEHLDEYRATNLSRYNATYTAQTAAWPNC